MNTPPKPLVRVTWHDAQDAGQPWMSEADAGAFGERLCEIVSVGFVVSKGPKYLTLAGDWDAEDENYGRVTKIPTGMVVSVEELP